MKKLITLGAFGALVAGCVCTCNCITNQNHKFFPNDPEPIEPTERMVLFNGQDYTGWDLWMNPSKPAYAKSAEEVFLVKDGVMHVTGEGYGGVTTKQAFKNYKLTMEFRFCGEGYGNRKGKTADGGLLFHCIGEEGLYGGTWHLSFEYNFIQGACGDLIVVGNMSKYPTTLRAKAFIDDLGRWNPSPKWNAKVRTLIGGGRVDNRFLPADANTWKDDEKTQLHTPPEKPYGEWNTATLICKGDTAEYLLNGKTVLKAFDLVPSAGRIQLQSECHGIEYRNIVIEPLEK